MRHKHLQHLFNPVDEMLKHKKEKILKSHWLTTYHPHWIYINHRMLIIVL